VSTTVVTYKEDITGWQKFTRTFPVQEKLRLKAEEFVLVAQGQFSAVSRHDDKPPEFYNSSFVVKRIVVPLQGGDDLPTWGYEVRNIDPIANLVEFGAHADGDINNFVLKYRIFGRTMDVLEAAGHL